MRKLITIIFTCFIILCGGSVKADAATLHVAHSSALSWSASYTIVTSGNKIKNVSNIKVSTRLGAITKTYMTKDSASKVTLHLTRSIGAVKYQAALSAHMQKGKLVVTFT
ncbi:Hypothetical protein UCCLB521_1925 [Levilactobacillus brevis]|uniref:DUF5626 family protein n=1 Tax=Levilactobacillus brevis TaxID=1580 RepID=UPI00063ABDAC|nr:DUF5626 family protein [Levilactobacillus brevis]KLE27226.1 hypothetical protein AAX72_13310 [Levilactobacillus brevis]MCT3570065.1 hypothetical protein [Levilactobacillus brevis]MCT3573546.1 hypothetical protein [Levilactobacillus brevis]MDM5047278.1 DUF5626 family protein [Levilactobacillus brevis]QCZ56480.1 Hypothetical protein UCCLB521_1925 [Levilactobacillus brevis]